MGVMQDDLRMFYALLNQAPFSITFKSYQHNGSGGFTGGAFVRVSKKKAEHYGLTISEIRGKTDSDLLPPDQAEKAEADDVHVMTTRTPMLFIREKITHKNGETVEVIAHKIPWIDENNIIRGVMCISMRVQEG